MVLYDTYMYIYSCIQCRYVYGMCVHLYVTFLPQTGRSRGFGFVYFEDCEDANDVSHTRTHTHTHTHINR